MDKTLLSITGSTIGIILALCVYIWISKIADIVKMIDELKNEVSELSKAFHELYGEHKTMACKTRRSKK